MKRFTTVLTGISFLFLLSFSLLAGDRFDRSAVLPAQPDDIGGFGNVVAGVDLDGDGKVEIYAVNDDWHDVAGKDWVPRIYKYEKNAMGKWEIVWWTRLKFSFQNTWPALAVGDLDKDGKGEVIWGPVNNLKPGNLNPPRIVVFETAGDGSDVMGIDNGDGTFSPNASWTIASQDNIELRPFRWFVYDIDNDGTDEIVASARRGDGIQVYSTSDVPDNGDGSEQWSLEFSGVSGTFYDLAIIDSTIYGIQSNGDVTPVTYSASGDSFRIGEKLVQAVPKGSWKSATVVDIDGDGTKEILVASWNSSTSNVYLVQQDADTLKTTLIADVPDEAFRLYGGAAGDLDNDGNLDFVFGTRQATPNASIYRLEYQGGDITDPANYELSLIDHDVSPALQYDIITTANLDDDPDDEVVYSGIPRGLGKEDPPQPLVILDRIEGNQPVITSVKDVPNDNGRQVRVSWVGSEDDAPGSDGMVITEYTVWRKIMAGMGKLSSSGKIIRLDNAMWEQVGTSKAIQAKEYALIVPTLYDKTDSSGPAMSTFVVIAHTPDPQMHYTSFPKSGFSVDNLIPTAPQNVTAKIDEDNQGVFVQLNWEEIPDEDFNYYEIYRGTTPDFNPDDVGPLAQTTDLTFIDRNIQLNVGETYYYSVVAYDFSGNRGKFSEPVNVTFTAVEEQTPDVIPTKFALQQNYPNPFNPSTQISYDVAKAGQVTITIYNLMGQKVRELVNAEQAPGRYTVQWDGRDSNGRSVASGTYIYVMRAKGFNVSRRMLLLK